MPEYIIQRHDLCMSDPAPFNQHWEARIAVAFDKIKDVGAALQPASQSLRAGDLVNIASFTKPDWRVMQEVASFRIISSGAKVRVIQVGETVKVPLQDLMAATEESPVMRVFRVGNSYEVRDSLGNVIEAFVDDKQARDFAERESRRKMPVVATSAPQDKPNPNPERKRGPGRPPKSDKAVAAQA